MVWDYPEYNAWVAAGKLDELAQKFNVKVQDFTTGFYLLPFQTVAEYIAACRKIPGLREAMEADGEALDGELLPAGIDLRRANEINNEAGYAAIRASRCEGGGSSDDERSYMDEKMQVQEEGEPS